MKHFQREVIPFETIVKDAGAGRVKALYLAASYPPRRGGWVSEEQATTLQTVPLVVCQDLLPSPVSNFAHYVLPGTSFAEKDGTFVNHAGLAQELHWGVTPTGECRTEGQVFLDLLERRGLVHAPTLRKEIAGTIAYFAATVRRRPRRIWHSAGKEELIPPVGAMLEFHLVLTLILIAVLMGVVQGTCAYLILLERKISAWAQDRIGPNRVGPFGLLQPIADGAKFLLKEELIPKHVDKLFYLLAPAIAISTSTLAIAVVPFGDTPVPPSRPWAQTMQQEQLYDQQHPEFKQQVKAYNESIPFVIAPHVDVGIVYVFAVGSLAAYGIVLAGWSSNNKYSFLGALRSSAQLISYEIPMGMSVVGVLLLTGSLNIERIIVYQAEHGWNIIFQPLACLLFVTSIFAECNRLPFDLPEAEQELVGGYHTEYSGLKFGLFFLGEYTHMITTSFLASALFFGGWLLPGLVTPETTGIGGMIAEIDRFRREDGAIHLFLHARSLDDPALPLRSVDGAGVEGADSAGAGESGGRDGGQAVLRSVGAVAVAAGVDCDPRRRHGADAASAESIDAEIGVLSRSWNVAGQSGHTALTCFLAACGLAVFLR